MLSITTIDGLSVGQIVFYRSIVPPKNWIRATIGAIDPKKADRVYVARPQGGGVKMLLTTIRLPEGSEADKKEIPFVAGPRPVAVHDKSETALRSDLKRMEMALRDVTPASRHVATDLAVTVIERVANLERQASSALHLLRDAQDASIRVSRLAR